MKHVLVFIFLFILTSCGPGELILSQPGITPTLEATAIPTQEPAMMLPEMRTAADCSLNSLDLNSPTFETDLAAMMESVTTQSPEAETNVMLTQVAAFGELKDLYHLASFYFQAFETDGLAPVVSCAEIRLNDRVGRVWIVRNFPFPTIGGGTEPITIGLIHEPSAELLTEQMKNTRFFTENMADGIVFPHVRNGIQQIRLQFFINPTAGEPERNDEFRAWLAPRLEFTQSIIIPQMFDQREQQNFSQLFMDVFSGDPDPEKIQRLRALMENQFIPGLIFIDTP